MCVCVHAYNLQAIRIKTDLIQFEISVFLFLSLPGTDSFHLWKILILVEYYMCSHKHPTLCP